MKIIFLVLENYADYEGSFDTAICAYSDSDSADLKVLELEEAYTAKLATYAAWLRAWKASKDRKWEAEHPEPPRADKGTSYYVKELELDP
jgi:hypothetical protein